MDDSLKNKQKGLVTGKEKNEKLPDAAYMQAVKLIKILKGQGFDAKLAGGCVRDRLLGIRPKDYDLASNATPEEVCLIFEQKGFKTVPTGIEHGTITVVTGGHGIEITSLRHDVSTDGRRATIAFAKSFEEDAARRDFTINAMYEDAEGTIHDYFGGQDDLKSGRLRFVGDPHQRIREDYLRILRLFRFWARFGFAPDAATLKACQEEEQGLALVSQERITSELLGTLEAEQLAPVLNAMGQTGILLRILGLAQATGILDDLDALKICNKTERAPARLALLLREKLGASAKDQTNMIASSLDRLRLPKKMQVKIQLHLVVDLKTLPEDIALQMEKLDEWEKLLGGASFLDELLPAWTILHKEASRELQELERLESQTHNRRIAKLPIDGQTLIRRLGLSPGPELGTLLLELSRSWRKHLWESPEEGLAYARKLLQR